MEDFEESPTTAAAPQPLIGVKRIEFQQAEGPSHACRLRSFFSWADVNNHVRNAARTAPADGSYFKCDIVIEWQNGARRYVRFDMQQEHARQWAAVSDACRSDVLFYSGRWHPDHMTDEQYRAFLANFDDTVIAHAAKLLNGYDLGVRV